MSIKRSRFFHLLNELDKDFDVIYNPCITYRIKKDEKQTELIIELTDLKKEDIKVDVREVDGVYQLTISFNNNEVIDNIKSKVKRPFNLSKTFTLSDEADINKVKAVYCENKLIITIPNIETNNINYSITPSIENPNQLVDEIKVTQ